MRCSFQSPLWDPARQQLPRSGGHPHPRDPCSLGCLWRVILRGGRIGGDICGGDTGAGLCGEGLCGRDGGLRVAGSVPEQARPPRPCGLGCWPPPGEPFPGVLAV